MKKIRYCKITILILAGWAILSAIGFLGKDTIYSRYTVDPVKTPYFVLVMQGIHDGIYPWSSDHESLWDKWEHLAELRRDEEQISATESTEPAAEGTESMAETETVAETEQEEVRSFHAVDAGYFSDAVFIGDSRTVGLHDYGGLNDSTFYATVGMNVYNLWTEKFCEVDGEKVTLEEALKAKKYGKIYFQIGINEMGRGTLDGFMTAYEDSVEKFRELQPDAVIFVQGIMKVAKEKSDKDPIFNNVGIEQRNERIAALADGKNIFYLDVRRHSSVWFKIWDLGGLPEGEWNLKKRYGAGISIIAFLLIVFLKNREGIFVEFQNAGISQFAQFIGHGRAVDREIVGKLLAVEWNGKG